MKEEFHKYIKPDDIKFSDICQTSKVNSILLVTLGSCFLNFFESLRLIKQFQRSIFKQIKCVVVNFTFTLKLVFLAWYGHAKRIDGMISMLSPKY